MNKDYLCEDLAKYLSGENWDLWITLTLNKPMREKKAKLRWDKMLSHFKDDVQFTRLTENHKSTKQIAHYHALIKGINGDNPQIYKKALLKIGRDSKIEIYNPSLRVNHYLSKYIKTYFVVN